MKMKTRNIITKLLIASFVAVAICFFNPVIKAGATTIIDTDTSMVDNLSSETTQSTTEQATTTKPEDSNVTQQSPEVNGNTENSGSSNSNEEMIDGMLNDSSITDLSIDNGIENVDTSGFFDKIMNKMYSGLNGFQKFVAIFLIICFIASIFMTIGSLLVKKKNVGHYVFAMFICIVLFICNLYAVEIMASINDWFKS